MTKHLIRCNHALRLAGKRAAAGAAILSLTACAAYFGPSVPARQGMSIYDAQSAVETCSLQAPEGGQGAVVGSYLFSIRFFGLLIGGADVLAGEEAARAQDEADGVDRCLEGMGYERRNLTGGEFDALETLSRHERVRLLSHFVSGGMLGTFS